MEAEDRTIYGAPMTSQGYGINYTRLGCCRNRGIQGYRKPTFAGGGDGGSEGVGVRGWRECSQVRLVLSVVPSLRLNTMCQNQFCDKAFTLERNKETNKNKNYFR